MEWINYFKKGWFRRARIKWINKNVYSYELRRRGTMGSDYIKVRKNPAEIRTVYFGSKADWQYDMQRVGGFAERFIWAKEIERKQPENFIFFYKLNKDLKY